MSRRLTSLPVLLVVGALVAPTTGRAQWSVGLELGGVTTATTSAGYVTGQGSPTILDLNLGTEGRATVWKQAGPWRIAVTASRVSHDRIVRTNTLSLLADGASFSRTEVGPTLGHRLFRLRGEGGVWFDAGPTLAIWSPPADRSRTRVGGIATLSAEWPVAGALVATFRLGVGVSASPDERSDFDPALFTPAYFDTAWRRWSAAGLRLQL